MGWDAELRILLTRCLYCILGRYIPWALDSSSNSASLYFMIIDSSIAVAAFLTLAISFSRALPHNNPPQDDPHQRSIPFDEFLEGVRGATFAQWNHTAVESADAFNVMKNHILTMYDGIGTINQSFVLDVEYGDCVDVLKHTTHPRS